MFTWMLYSWTLAPLDLTLDCTQIWTALLFHWKGSLKLLHATYRSLTALTGSQGTIIGSLPSALVPTMLLASQDSSGSFPGSQGTIIGSLIAPWCPLCSLLHQDTSRGSQLTLDPHTGFTSL